MELYVKLTRPRHFVLLEENENILNIKIIFIKLQFNLGQKKSSNYTHFVGFSRRKIYRLSYSITF